MRKHDIRALLDSLQRNVKLTQYRAPDVFKAFDEPSKIIAAFHTTNDAITIDKNLTTVGQRAAATAAGNAAIAALTKWHDAKTPGLMADIAAKKKMLLHTDQADLARTAELRQQLIGFSPLERQVLYDSADAPTKLAIEHAALAAGKVPQKIQGGGVEWRPLISQEAIDEARISRAIAKNPTGMVGLSELEQVAAMHDTIKHQAVAEVFEFVPELMPRGQAS